MEISSIHPLPTACLTFDLHASDRPQDIDYAVAWLEARRLHATFFVPAEMFDVADLRQALRRATASPLIELGSHSYYHTIDEIEGLIAGERLGFLHAAHARHSDALGTAPHAFRAPCWVPMAPRALDTLAELGYRVDSSATPGRPALLSSFVGRASWREAPRHPFWVRPSLLEVPQSTRLVPFAVPTFMTLRGAGSRRLARHLGREILDRPERVLVVMLHVGDLNPQAPDYWRPSVTWRSFVPRRGTGLSIKYAFRVTQRPEVAEIVATVLDELEGAYDFLRMQDVWAHRAPPRRRPSNEASHVHLHASTHA